MIFEIICLLDGYSAGLRSLEYCFSFLMLFVRLARLFSEACDDVACVGMQLSFMTIIHMF